MADFETTEDTLLGGKIRVRQPARGYRVNVDTLLLAAAVPVTPQRGGMRIAELGCGAGAALFAVAAAYAEARDIQFIGIERDPAYAALARQNIDLNGLAGRAEVIEGDALDVRAEYGLFDHVLVNPPYDGAGEGRPPGEGKRAAFVADRPVGEWIKVWSNRMRADASITLIHRAHRLNDILSALEGRLGGVEVYPIRPNASAPAQRIIVRARKGSRAPLRLHAGLDLHPAHDTEDKYTPEAGAMLRGELRIMPA